MLSQLSLLLKQRNINLSSIIPFSSSLSKVTKLSGLSNTTYKLTFQDSKLPQLALKLFEDFFPQFVNRNREKIVLAKASQAKLCQKIYKSQSWGFVYEFVPGEQLNRRDLNTSTYQKIISQLLNLSKLNVNIKEQTEQIRLFPNLITKFRQISKEMQNKFPQQVKRNQNLISDILDSSVISNITKILPQQRVFSHNDVNLTNLIKTESGLMLIDYEFAGFNYVGFDIGNLFNQLATQYSDKFQIKSQWQVPEKQKQKMIEKYFKQLKLDLHEAEKKVNIGRLLSHQFWFFVGLLSFKDPTCRLDLDYYLKKRHQHFFKYYNDLCSK